jgi:diaminopimelate decarboxylase
LGKRMHSAALANALHYFQVRDGELLCGGVPISQLTARSPTPFYLYDLQVARRKYQRLRTAMPRDIDIHYAIKANPHPDIIRFFQTMGAGFDVASMGELHRALQVGVAPRSCGFAGPGKSQQELEHAIRNGIGSLHVESEAELEQVDAIAGRLGMHANASLRINPAFQLKGSGMRIGGGPQAFGIDEEQVPHLLSRIAKMKHVHFTGFHLFAGSQNLKAAALIEFFSLSFSLLKELAPLCPLPPQVINLGGGFGIPYFPHDTELDIETVGARLGELLTAYREHFPHARFVIESGRYLIGESGVYVTRVRYKKVSRGETFVIVDGGLHHHLAATGNFGQVIPRNYPIALLQSLDKPSVEKVNIVGPLCTPLDRLGSAVEVSTVEEGDIFGIFASGAYGFSASPRSFLSHPEPIEIVLDDKHDAPVQQEV